MKLTHSSSIKRIDASSQREIEMMREAIRGEFEPGKYLRDMSTGALSGAAGGAMIGGGVGSLPAAAVGAISGAAWGLGANATSDIWYQTRSDEDKASWQAGDLQERLKKMGDFLTNKTKSPEIGAELNKIGIQYKNYIDIVVQKNDDFSQKKMYEQNMFNPSTDIYKSLKNQYSQKTSGEKFLRIVEAADTSPAAMIGGIASGVGAEQALHKITPNDIAGQAGGQLNNPNLLKNVWKGTKGLGVGLGVDLLSNWGLDKIDMAMTGGEVNMFRREITDVGKIITEINRLTKNQEDVVYAGNMLWTSLKEIDRMLAQVENKKSLTPQTANQSLPVNTPNQASFTTTMPNNTGPIMSSNSSKFKRLG